MSRRIVLTRLDVGRLRAILARQPHTSRLDREHALDLGNEIEQATIVEDHELATDVVTMDSKVCVRDMATGEIQEYTLVSPLQADVAASHISVLAPMGTALLGFRQGDQVEWHMPGGVRHLTIHKVTQPPAARIDRAARMPLQHGVAARLTPLSLREH
ncbi:MAG TPA: GreA/GreB family elongation factor [Steroidobacteraceae bacterium]|jgi:regulator of nucleoside diphosphate kinase